MENAAGTGRFWLCPVCQKHVPGRTDKCRCGFDRSTVNVAIPELPGPGRSVVSGAPPADERRPRALSLPMAIGFGLAFLGSIWVWRVSQDSDRANAELRQRLEERRAQRERGAAPPQIIVVPQPVPAQTAPPSAAPILVEAPTPAAPVATAPGPEAPRSEEERARALAVAVYRPYIERAAPLVRQWRVQRRRYVDACLANTVTVRQGSEAGQESSGGVGVASATGHAQVYGPRGERVGSVDATGDTRMGWSEARYSSRQWSEVSAVDNSTTPGCRLIASDLSDLAPKISALMDEADRDAVQAKVWTWLQTDVPNALAAELWRE